MTREQQIEFDIITLEVRVLLDAASSIFSVLDEDYFSRDSMPKELEWRYSTVRENFYAASVILHKACTILDCIAGDNTPRAQAFRRNSAELIAYLDMGAAS